MVTIEGRAFVVLVIDDDALIRMDVTHMLEMDGFVVVEAADADEAVRTLEERRDIWAILTDVDMPGSMDGIKLAHAVRDRWPPVHIFVMSGHRAVELGQLPERSSFFPKPFEAKAVTDALRAAMTA